MWAFQFCSLWIFRKLDVWTAWPCYNSYRSHAGNSSFLLLAQAQFLSWRSLWTSLGIFYGKISGRCEQTVSYFYHLSLHPLPDLNFFHCFEKKIFYNTVFLLMFSANMIFSTQYAKSDLQEFSNMCWMTSFAYVFSPPLLFPLCVCTALRLQ